MKQKILLYGGAAVLLLVILIAAVAGTSKPKMESAGIAGTGQSEQQPETVPEQQETPEIPDSGEPDETDGQTEGSAAEETAQGKVHRSPETEVEDDKEIAGSMQTVPLDEKPAGAPAAPKQEQDEKSEPANIIADGTYQIGKDLKAGEYIVFAGEMAILENRSDLTNDFDSVIFNIALDNYSHAYVTLQNGEYFKLEGGEMYPAASAPSVKPADGVYKAGQYKIGADLPAGTYKVTVDDANDIGFYEINQNSRQSMFDIVEEDVVESAVTITVSNGQYVTLRNAKIELR